MTAAVSFHDVSRSYPRGVRGVSGLTLNVEEGVTLGMVGRNGAGKTTAIHIAMGMLRPDAGSIRVFDRDPFREGVAVRREIGFVAEDHGLPGLLRPAEVFALYRELYPTWDRAFEQELVEHLDLPLDRRLAALSVGQRRQVALIGALAHRPKLLLLDEPAGGLDPVVRREFLELVLRLVNEAGTTVVFSSHVLSEVERIADRIAVIHEGRVLVEKETDALREGACRLLVKGTHVETLQRLPGCVGTEARSGTTVLTFLAEEETARHTAADHGLEVIQSSPLSFEEIFFGLVGNKR